MHACRSTLEDPTTGKRVPPPVPNTVQLYGLPSGHVAARTKNGEVHLATARGKPFVKVASGVDVVAYDGKAFVLQSQNGNTRLSLDGKVGPLTTPPAMMTSENVLAFGEFPDMTKPPPRESDVDRMIAPLTVAMDDGGVMLVEEHDLVFFDGQRGVEASRQKDAFAKHENCFPMRGGTPAFVGCNEPAGMVLFRVDAADRPPVPEKTLPGVVTSDFGFPAPGSSLVFDHRCNGAPGLGALCVRRNEHTWSEIIVSDPQRLLATAPFMASVVATKDAEAFGFAWQNGNGALIVIDGQNNAVRAVPKAAMPAWAHGGIRWQGASASDGAVRFLLTGGRAGVMTIDAKGHVDAQPLKGSLAAAGPRGLLVTADGKVSETIDAGRTWHDVDPPPGGADPTSLDCFEGGCTVGPWHRLGWRR